MWGFLSWTESSRGSVWSPTPQYGICGSVCASTEIKAPLTWRDTRHWLVKSNFCADLDGRRSPTAADCCFLDPMKNRSESRRPCCFFILMQDFFSSHAAEIHREADANEEICFCRILRLPAELELTRWRDSPLRSAQSCRNLLLCCYF